MKRQAEVPHSASMYGRRPSGMAPMQSQPNGLSASGFEQRPDRR